MLCRTTETVKTVMKAAPLKLNPPFFDIQTQGVQVRYDAELPPFISISGTPVVQSCWAWIFLLILYNCSYLGFFSGGGVEGKRAFEGQGKEHPKNHLRLFFGLKKILIF